MITYNPKETNDKEKAKKRLQAYAEKLARKEPEKKAKGGK